MLYFSSECFLHHNHNKIGVDVSISIINFQFIVILFIKNYNDLIASFNSFPGLNAGTFEAGMVISSPV